MSYRHTIRAIIGTLDELALAPDAQLDDEQLETVCDEIIDRQQHMPDYMRLPLRLLTRAFAWWSVPRRLRRFQNLASDKRVRQLLAWRRSRVGLFRNLVRFYESLFLLIALQERRR